MKPIMYFVFIYYVLFPSQDDDLDESLNSAMKTAGALKKMSNRMKSTLKDELTRSYSESHLVKGY